MKTPTIVLALLLVVVVLTGTTAFAEEQRLTILYMRTYGIRFVRGADALNTRADCYTPGSIQFWVPKPLREAALRGELGQVDPQPVFAF